MTKKFLIMLHSEVMAELFLVLLGLASTGTGEVGFISMTEPFKLVKKAIGRLDASWNSVKQQIIAWSLSQSLLVTCIVFNVCVRVTEHDSIEHVKKGFFVKSGVMFIVAQLVESKVCVSCGRSWVQSPFKLFFL